MIRCLLDHAPTNANSRPPRDTTAMAREEQLDVLSTASNPAGLSLSMKKLRGLEPWMFGTRHVLRRIGGSLIGLVFVDAVDAEDLSEHLAAGDARAAVVLSTTPLLVAAYSDDLDCVAMLRFGGDFVERYRLGVGDQLLTVNTYYDEFTTHGDLMFGPNRAAEWSGFFPVIADFLSDDAEQIEQRKREIDQHEWQRCRELGEAYLAQRPGVSRGGRPRLSCRPAGFFKTVIIGTAIAILGIAAFVILAWMFL